LKRVGWVRSSRAIRDEGTIADGNVPAPDQYEPPPASVEQYGREFSDEHGVRTTKPDGTTMTREVRMALDDIPRAAGAPKRRAVIRAMSLAVG
jgi:hypothetical protein